jgi:hypothetical protein
MSYNDSLHDLTFQNSGKKYRLTRMRNLHNSSSPNIESIQQILPSPNFGLIFFRRLIRLVSIADLRKFLGPSDHLHNSRDDEPIRSRIATLFLDGTLSLFELTKPVSPVRNSSSTNSPEKYKVSYDDVDARQMQSPSDLLINQQPSAKLDATPKNDPVVNEQAQAAVLMAAAEQGVALCELCLE